MAPVRAQPVVAQAGAAIAAFLRVYAQVLFSRSPWVGLLLLAATATVPRAAFAGALAVMVATATAAALELDPEPTRAGDFSYPALLVGLGVGQTFGGGPGAMALLVAAAAASVLLTAALRASFASASLPVLSLPFVLALYLLLGLAAPFGLALRLPEADPTLLAASLPPGVVLFLRSLGGLFFLPRLDAGALVFAALVVHSRIAASLAAAAFTLAIWAAGRVEALPSASGVEILGYNAMFTAMAIGGVFFVPSTSSFALALAGAALAVALALGLAGPLARMGLPVSILPFNAAVLLLLHGLRQRARDLAPKSVDFLPGTPEENLAYYRTRRSRFEWLHAVPFQLPLRGRWVCTQGVDGPHTHQGAWRHAFDFEVRDADGRLADGDGLRNEDHHCFRLPVLAAADGTVVAVESALPDNAVGAMDLEHNWGNHVLVQHGVGLYSLVAHLAKGSVKVVKGQIVRRGEVLGLCGSSGRSPRPHVHFQLQATAELGAPTLPCHFTDVVVVGSPCRLGTACTPAEGAVLENLDPSDEVSAYFPFEVGQRLAWRAGESVEHLAIEADLYGRLLLRSRDRGATLFYGRSDAFFTAYDAVGDRASALHLLRTALPRVPFAAASSALVWTDHLPARHFRPWLGRVLHDVLSPFLPRDGIEMELSLRREGATLVIEGASKRRDRRGAPLVRTRAELARGVGPTRVEVTVRGKTRSAARIEA